MADKYQKNLKAASFKKHKEILVRNAKISIFFIVAELNNVILAFTNVKFVTERLKYLLFLWSQTYAASEIPGNWNGSMEIKRSVWNIGESHWLKKRVIIEIITQQHIYSKNNLIWVEFLRSEYNNFDQNFILGNLEPDLTSCGFVSTADMWNCNQMHCSLKSNFLLLIAKYSLIKPISIL